MSAPGFLQRLPRWFAAGAPRPPGAAPRLLRPEGLPPLSGESRLELHETVVHREPGRAPLLGCLHAQRFLEVDEDTILAVAAITRSPSIQAAERALLDETGDEYDLLDLANRLLDRGFVAAVDGKPLEGQEAAAKRHAYLYKVPPSRVQWIHSPILFAAVGLLLAGWLAALFTTPEIRPRFSDLWVYPRPGVILAGSFLGFVAFAYLHELAHFFMARSYGVDAKIRITHRLYLLTFETDVTNAWVLPAAKRLHIFLAGMGFNLLVASTLGLAVWGMERGLVGHAEWAPLLRFLVFLNFFPLFFQFLVFARTDLYYVLLLVTKERNLAADARAYVTMWARRAYRFFVPSHPSDACPACAKRTYSEEPFCVRCGRHLGDLHPYAYPLDYASRRRLFAFGVVLLAGQFVGIAYMLGVSARFVALQAFGGALWAARGWRERDALTTIEGAVVLLLAGLQFGFILFFFAGDLVRKTGRLAARAAGALARLAAHVTPAGAAVAVGAALPPPTAAHGPLASPRAQAEARDPREGARRKRSKNKAKRRRARRRGG